MSGSKKWCCSHLQCCSGIMFEQSYFGNRMAILCRRDGIGGLILVEGVRYFVANRLPVNGFSFREMRKVENRAVIGASHSQNLTSNTLCSVIHILDTRVLVILFRSSRKIYPLTANREELLCCHRLIWLCCHWYDRSAIADNIVSPLIQKYYGAPLSKLDNNLLKYKKALG